MRGRARLHGKKYSAAPFQTSIFLSAGGTNSEVYDLKGVAHLQLDQRKEALSNWNSAIHHPTKLMIIDAFPESDLCYLETSELAGYHQFVELSHYQASRFTGTFLVLAGRIFVFSRKNSLN